MQPATEEEIIQLYGKRWDIEVFFKVLEQVIGVKTSININRGESVRIAYEYLGTYPRDEITGAKSVSC